MVHYELQLSYETGIGRYAMAYVFKTLDEVKEKMKENKEKKEVAFKVTEYRLVYDHNNPLPNPSGYNAFFEENTYEKNTLQDVRPAHINEYKDNIQDYSETFKISYSVLTRVVKFQDTFAPLDYYKETKCVYTAKSLKDAKKALYSHTRSRLMYEIKMYQCRELNVNVIEETL